MEPNTLSSKLYRRVIRHSMRALGRDSITRTKLSRRSDMIHIGSVYGGWVVPESLLHSDSVCYCVGCGEDISFDLGLIDLFGCEVHGFDPTPRAIAYVAREATNHSKYFFEPVGVWEREETLRFYAPKDPAHVSHSLVNLQKTDQFIEVPVKSLRALMYSRGHDRLDLLKLDTEGAEYTILNSMLRDCLLPRVLCIEYDEWFNPLDSNWQKRISESILQLLSRQYEIAHDRGDGNYTFVLAD